MPDKVFFFGTDEIFAAGVAVAAPRTTCALYQTLKRSDLPMVQECQDTSRTFVEELLKVGALPGMKARMPDTEGGTTTLVALPEFTKWVLRRSRTWDRQTKLPRTLNDTKTLRPRRLGR